MYNILSIRRQPQTFAHFFEEIEIQTEFANCFDIR